MAAEVSANQGNKELACTCLNAVRKARGISVQLKADELSEQEKEKVSHGMALDIKTQDEILILTYQSELVAIAKVENNKAKMQKVFI